VLECESIESNETTEDSNVRLATPMRPLVPAYQLSEPLNVSKVRLPQILCQNQSPDEFTLPPGYVTTILNASNKNWDYNLIWIFSILWLEQNFMANNIHNALLMHQLFKFHTFF
jgi:hypothetical protein